MQFLIYFIKGLLYKNDLYLKYTDIFAVTAIEKILFRILRKFRFLENIYPLKYDGIMDQLTHKL